VPFGEVFIDERNGNWSTPYKFNGKEQDEETGLYYYGARYYDSRTSVWLSVDPLAEKFADGSSYEFCLSNPMKFIDFNGMDPTEKEAKAISANVYTSSKNGEMVAGWTLEKRIDDDKTGFKSALYSRKMKNNESEYCYATAGTDEGKEGEKDWKNNFDQVNGNSEQYKESVMNARSLAQDKDIGKHLSFTGHSLGGGLAAANAYATGRHAQIFNPSRLSNATFTALNLRCQNAKIDSYIEFFEPLNAFQSLLPNGVIMHSMPNEIKHYELHTLKLLTKHAHEIETMQSPTLFH
jgi:RHS repeat-associated protein